MADNQKDALLPPMRPPRYARARIDAAIAEAFFFPVVVFAAPAGWAKSHEARTYIERIGLRHVIYTLQERNTTLAGFMRGLAIVAGVGAGDGADILSTSEQVGDVDADQITAWLSQRLDDALHTIVIDDFHKIHDERIVLLLDRLINNTVPLRRWVIITREPARLPIDSWISSGYLRAPIGVDDLRFTFSESVDFLRAAGATTSNIEGLSDLANGWPLALSLLGVLGSRVRDPLDNPIASEYSRELIYDLLRENVFRTMSPHDQAFLLETCITETVIAGFWLANERSAAVETLQRLASRCSQVSEIADGVWQYHETFRSFLLQELHSRGRECFDAARLLGAKRYENIAYYAEAMTLYMELKRRDDVISILRTYGITHFLERGHVHPLRHALRWLGDVDVDDPVLLALGGAVIINDGKYDLGLARLERALSMATTDRQYAEIACLLVYQLVRGVDPSRRAFMESLLERDFLTPDERAVVLGRLAMAYLRDGETARAEATMELAYALGAGNAETKAVLDSMRALLAQCNDDFAQCISLLHSARQIAVPRRLFRLASAIERVWYETYYEMDDLRECELAAERMYQFGTATGDRHDEQRAIIYLLSIASQRGDDDEIVRLQQMTEPHILADDTIWYHRIVPMVQALSDAWAGDFKGALGQIRGTTASLRPVQQLSRWSQIALFAAAAGESDEAWAALRETRPEEPIRNWRTARNVMRCALTAALLGDIGQARSLLARLLSSDVHFTAHFRASLEATRAFVEWLETPAAEEALRLYDAIRAIPRDSRGFGRILLKLRAMNPLDRAFATLTQMERRILRLLIGGHNEAEIAQAFGRAQHTIQGHIQSICGKVGIKKTSLIAKAIERRITPLMLFSFTMEVRSKRVLTDDEVATLERLTGASIIKWTDRAGSLLFVRDAPSRSDAIAAAHRDVVGLLDGAGVEVGWVEPLDPPDQDWLLSH